MTETEQAGSGLSLTTQITMGIVLGLGCGLFFGESCSWLKWISLAYVGLLQMSVLPYVMLSLVVNVGRLSVSQGLSLAKVGIAVLLSLWAIGLAALLVMQQAFPEWEAGSFFSTSFLEEPPKPNWLDLFIPSNPFSSLSNNYVPAVVLFSIGLGVALIRVKAKELLLNQLDVLLDALSQLNQFVVKLSPLGMFAILAETSGTLDMHQFELLQGYLIAYGAAAMLLSLWLLPTLISCCTPFSYRDVMNASKNALISAFVIGNSFVVLPLIADGMKQLFEQHKLDRNRTGPPPEFEVPMAYPFPDIGRIVGLLFIPFAAWFYGMSIDATKYPALIGVGLLGSFGKPIVTIPLLLDLAQIPADIFNLYLSMGVLASRFGDVMKTMHLVTFAALTSCAMLGMFRINWRKLTIGAVISGAAFALAVLVIRGYLEVSFKDDYQRENLIAERPLLENPIKSTVFQYSAKNPVAFQDGESRIDRILRRGVIRVGFDIDELPFSYFNANGDLVGHDIDMAHRLARDLGVTLEFVPFETNTLPERLNADHFDVAMGGLEGTIRRASALQLGQSYMDVTLALVVLDHRKAEFASVGKIKSSPPMTLAVLSDSYFEERIKEAAPRAEIVTLNSEASFFEQDSGDIDALVTSAETGSAWTLRQPKYAVVNPFESSVRIPLYYMTAPDAKWENFLKSWLELKRKDGTSKEFYDYWILGEDKQEKRPRWCVVRDVLHWGP